MKSLELRSFLTLVLSAALLVSQPMEVLATAETSVDAGIDIEDAAFFYASDTSSDSSMMEAAADAGSDDASAETSAISENTENVENGDFLLANAKSEEAAPEPQTEEPASETQTEEPASETQTEEPASEPQTEEPATEPQAAEAAISDQAEEGAAESGSTDPASIEAETTPAQDENIPENGSAAEDVSMPEPAENENNTESDNITSTPEEPGTEETAAQKNEEADPEEPQEMMVAAATEEISEPLNAFSFQSDNLIKLFNNKMNVTDASILAQYNEMGASLSAVSATLSGDIATNVDAILRTYYAYTALDLTGVDPGFTYPDGYLDWWNSHKRTILDEGVVVTAVLPSVDIMSVDVSGKVITVKTEEVYLIKASGTTEKVLRYGFHSVFSFLNETDTVILTGVKYLELYNSTNSANASMSALASSYTGGDFGVASNAMVEKAIQKGLAIAADQTHGYSQANRWGPDYDCSSFVITCFGYAGFALGYYNWPNDTNHEQDLYYTGNLRQPFIDAGFTWIPASELGGMETSAYLKRGDIVLREYHHTEIYIGNGYLVGAHGQIATDSHPNRSSATGDQGDELSVIEYTNYYGKGYDGVLRMVSSSSTKYDTEDSDSTSSTQYKTGTYTINTALNVRTGPDKTYSIAFTLSEDDVVSVSSVSGKWGKIGTDRWISLDYATYKSSTVTKTNISKVSVSGLASSYTYANKAIKPSLKLTYKGTTLKNGVDYTIQYKNNKIARTNAKIILTGIGDSFTGTRTLTFKIIPKAGTYKTSGAIALRASANSSASSYKTIPSGTFIYATKIKVVSSRYWAKTTYGGKTGWFMFGAGSYISSFDIATGMVTDGEISTSDTYMLVSVSNPEYSLSAPSLAPNSYMRFYKVKRISEKQRFTFSKSSAGGYNLVSCYTEQIVSPKNNKKTKGTKLTLNPAGSTAVKSWNIKSNADGTFSLINVASELAFRSASGKTAYKGLLELAAQSTSDKSQKFYLVKMPDVNHSYDGLYYIMKGKTTASYCLKVKGGSKVTGAKVVLYKKSSAACKKFRLVYSGDGYYRIVASNTGFVVTLKDNSKKKGTLLVMEEWKGYKSQRWKLVANTDGTVCFVNVNGYALTLTSNKIANNTAIRANVLKKSKYDKWVLKKA